MVDEVYSPKDFAIDVVSRRPLIDPSLHGMVYPESNHNLEERTQRWVHKSNPLSRIPLQPAHGKSPIAGSTSVGSTLNPSNWGECSQIRHAQTTQESTCCRHVIWNRLCVGTQSACGNLNGPQNPLKTHFTWLHMKNKTRVQETAEFAS